jgi:hypothetical protein
VALAGLVLVAASCAPGATGDSAIPHGMGNAGARVPDELATRCPPALDPVRYPEGDLPAGAVSVRLCPGRPIVASDGTIFDPGIQPPADVLTRRVDQLVAAVNDLRTTPEELTCFADGGPRLTYWFSYPDDDARAVTFEHFGCGLLWMGAEEARLDGARVARLFTEALLEQRAAAGDPPGAGPVPSCEGVWSEPSTALPPVPADLETATLCVGVGAYRQAPAAMPRELVERVEDELAASSAGSGPCRADRPFVTVVAVTVWQDRVVYPFDPCGRADLGYAAGWPRDSARSYELSDALLADLDALPEGPAVRTESPTRKTTPPASPG